MKRKFFTPMDMADAMFNLGYTREEIEDKISSILEASNEMDTYGFHEETQESLLRHHNEAILPPEW